MNFTIDILEIYFQWKRRGVTHTFFEEDALHRSWYCIPQGVRRRIRMTRLSMVFASTTSVEEMK
jgi:hypothetical protein